MSNSFHQKKSEIAERLAYAKADIKKELAILENKPFYSHREFHNLKVDGWMKFLVGVSAGLLIAVIASHL